MVLPPLEYQGDIAAPSEGPSNPNPSPEPARGWGRPRSQRWRPRGMLRAYSTSSPLQVAHCASGTSSTPRSSPLEELILVILSGLFSAPLVAKPRMQGWNSYLPIIERGVGVERQSAPRLLIPVEGSGWSWCAAWHPRLLGVEGFSESVELAFRGGRVSTLTSTSMVPAAGVASGLAPSLVEYGGGACRGRVLGGLWVGVCRWVSSLWLCSTLGSWRVACPRGLARPCWGRLLWARL